MNGIKQADRIDQILHTAEDLTTKEISDLLAVLTLVCDKYNIDGKRISPLEVKQRFDNVDRLQRKKSNKTSWPEETLNRMWIEYWESKGYLVSRRTGKFSDNKLWNGLKELRDFEFESGKQLPMDPQYIIFYQRKGYKVDLKTGKLSAVQYE